MTAVSRPVDCSVGDSEGDLHLQTTYYRTVQCHLPLKCPETPSSDQNRSGVLFKRIGHNLVGLLSTPISVTLGPIFPIARLSQMMYSVHYIRRRVYRTKSCGAFRRSSSRPNPRSKAAEHKHFVVLLLVQSKK